MDYERNSHRLFLSTTSEFAESAVRNHEEIKIADF